MRKGSGRLFCPAGLAADTIWFNFAHPDRSQVGKGAVTNRLHCLGRTPIVPCENTSTAVGIPTQQRVTTATDMCQLTLRMYKTQAPV